MEDTPLPKRIDIPLLIKPGLGEEPKRELEKTAKYYEERPRGLHGAARYLRELIACDGTPGPVVSAPSLQLLRCFSAKVLKPTTTVLEDPNDPELLPDEMAQLPDTGLIMDDNTPLEAPDEQLQAFTKACVPRPAAVVVAPKAKAKRQILKRPGSAQKGSLAKRPAADAGPPSVPTLAAGAPPSRMEPMAPPGSEKPRKGFPKKDVFLKPVDANGKLGCGSCRHKPRGCRRCRIKAGWFTNEDGAWDC